MPARCDVTAVGGGPAMSTVATVLVTAGLGIVCFEAARLTRCRQRRLELIPGSLLSW